MELFKLPAGTVIFKSGDAARQAYLIQQGTVELLREQGGELVRLTELESGEVFGEMSLIEERPHSLTARAASAVELSGLTRDDFENLLTSDPTTFRVYLKILFERLRTLSAQVDGAGPAPLAKPAGLTVTIHPVTRRAAATLPHDGLAVTRFPFRIGRAAAEHEQIPLDMNDLWLIDEMPFNISRNHASLECENGEVIVRDRGSSLGIHVNDVHIGGKAKERQAVLEDGDNVVVLGSRMSRYQFRINVART
jgi:CRP-like cAMP-binding protein